MIFLTPNKGEKMKLLKNIINNEDKNTCLTSSFIELNDNLIRYNNNELPDMYDNNYFEMKVEINEEEFKKILKYKEQRSEKHLKITSPIKSTFLIDKGLEEGILLTMLKEDMKYPDKCKLDLSFKCIKEENIKEDLISLEVKHYADIYGLDFTLRKSHFFYDWAKDRDNNLYYFGTYLNNKLVCSSSAFVSDEVIGVDDLLTDRDYQHQGFATEMIKYIHNYFGCPLFLHADNDDTPKEMYKKLGFIVVKKQYEYFRKD